MGAVHLRHGGVSSIGLEIWIVSRTRGIVLGRFRIREREHCVSGLLTADEEGYKPCGSQ